MIRTIQANGFHLLYFLSNTKGWQRWKEIENLRVWRSTIKSWDWNLKKMSEFNFRYSVSSTTASCLAATADTRKFVPSLLLVWNCLYCNWHWAVCGKFFDHWKSHRLHKKLFQRIYEQELSRTNERHYLWMWTELQSHGKFDLKCCCKTSRYFFWVKLNSTKLEIFFLDVLWAYKLLPKSSKLCQIKRRQPGTGDLAGTLCWEIFFEIHTFLLSAIGKNFWRA